MEIENKDDKSEVINKTLSFTPEKLEDERLNVIKNNDMLGKELEVILEPKVTNENGKVLKPRKPQQPNNGGRPIEQSQNGQRPGRGRKLSTTSIKKLDEGTN